MKKIILFLVLISGVIFCQNKPIVSLTNGNYWIYSLKCDGSPVYGSPSYQGFIKKKIICDTIINNISCKKTEVTKYIITSTNPNQKDSKEVVYEYWHSDSVIYSKYNGSSFSICYDTRIKNDSIFGYLRNQKIYLSAENIFNDNCKTQRYHIEFYDSSYNDSTFAEKYGLIHVINYARHYQLIHTDLIGAYIDNVYYGEIVPTDVIENIPIKHSLNNNYPNPFNSVTTIKFSIARESYITLKIYDVIGKEIRTLVNEFKPVGNYQVEFDASDFVSGIYIYQLKSPYYLESKKMILLK